MNNQSSPAQLLFPTGPANYCPEGRWSDILNSFIQLYLNNGTINIPGLGLVTPDQIQTINQNIQNLQNQYDAIAVNVRSGSITAITVGSLGTYAVSFATAMPNSNYLINIEFVATGTPTTTSMNYSVATGTKTNTGFTFYSKILTTDSILSINWTASSVITN
jgi:hypothetical protein